MKTLSIDIETYSDEPLQETGVYRYVESPDFEILLFAYSVDSQPVHTTLQLYSDAIIQVFYLINNLCHPFRCLLLLMSKSSMLLPHISLLCRL